MKKNGIFFFAKSPLILELFEKKSDVTSGLSLEANHKIKNLFGNIEDTQ